MLDSKLISIQKFHDRITRGHIHRDFSILQSLKEKLAVSTFQNWIQRNGLLNVRQNLESQAMR